MKGQALVEMAVVLPVLCLGIVVTVQLIAFCHNTVVLQRIAAQEARRLSAEAAAPVVRSHRLWGHTLPAVPRRSTETLRPWRPFKGEASVVKTPGYLSSIRITNRLLAGRGYRWIIPPVPLEATAETVIEPPLPRGD